MLGKKELEILVRQTGSLVQVGSGKLIVDFVSQDRNAPGLMSFRYMKGVQENTERDDW